MLVFRNKYSPIMVRLSPKAVMPQSNISNNNSVQNTETFQKHSTSSLAVSETKHAVNELLIYSNEEINLQRVGKTLSNGEYNTNSNQKAKCLTDNMSSKSVPSETDKTFFCHASESSFGDKNKYSKLRSIDELFACPNEEMNSKDIENIDNSLPSVSSDIFLKNDFNNGTDCSTEQSYSGLKSAETDKNSSCHTSECSFEIGSDDENKYSQLRSIDELFACPPAADDDQNMESHENHVIEEDIDNAVHFHSEKLSSSKISDGDSKIHEDDDMDEDVDDIVDFQPVKFSPPVKKDFQTDSDEITTNSNLCWSCQKENPKYKCPRCSRKTCSVQCVKHHKEKLNCNGERNKTEYVGKQDFSESQFLSDYRFLEEINRCVSKRNYVPRHNFKSKSMKILSNKAYSMNIRLKLLPISFKRRKENSTFYCFKNRQFLWHVEWMFDCCDVIVQDRRLPDTSTLLNSVEKFITASSDNNLYDPRLHLYNENKDEICFYMKREGLPANEIKYDKLDGDQSLRSNLHKKHIVEYPRIFVLLSSRAQELEKFLSQT